MECRALIPEKNGNGNSAMASDNRYEIKETDSESECNEYLREGWGILNTSPSHHYDEERGMMYDGVWYVMYRTAK